MLTFTAAGGGYNPNINGEMHRQMEQDASVRPSVERGSDAAAGQVVRTPTAKGDEPDSGRWACLEGSEAV